jgi:hypothetical protein
MRNVRRLEGWSLTLLIVVTTWTRTRSHSLNARTAWVVLRRLYRTKDAQKLAAVTIGRRDAGQAGRGEGGGTPRHNATSLNPVGIVLAVVALALLWVPSYAKVPR